MPGGCTATPYAAARKKEEAGRQADRGYVTSELSIL